MAESPSHLHITKHRRCQEPDDGGEGRFIKALRLSLLLSVTRSSPHGQPGLFFQLGSGGSSRARDSP